MREFLVMLALAAVAACGLAQSAGVAGEWRGVWTNPDGFVYSADLTLQSGPSCKTCTAGDEGSIRGAIVWTLRKAGPAATSELVSKVGRSGTEYVLGEISSNGLLTLHGYKKDDPNTLIDLDRYRLVLGENGKVLGGLTGDHDTWTGQLIATRVTP